MFLSLASQTVSVAFDENTVRTKKADGRAERRASHKSEPGLIRLTLKEGQELPNFSQQPVDTGLSLLITK